MNSEAKFIKLNSKDRQMNINIVSKSEESRKNLCSYQDHVQILSLSLNNITQNELLRRLENGICFTPNIDHLIKLEKDKEFAKVYGQANYKVCDSQLLIYASYFLGKPIKEKISGSDFFPAFYKYHRSNLDVRIYLLGGGEGSAPTAQKKINQLIGRDIVVCSRTPSFGFEKNEQECLEIIEEINRVNPTVLVVGLGAPKQEKWIVKYKSLMPRVKIYLAVGAAIDFEAGIKKRAPKWMSNLGLEWFFRFLSEPRRLFRRYFIDDLPFIILLLKQKLGLYSFPDV